MNILFFDVETTGLPRDHKAPITDLGNWPHIVQIAFQYCKDDKVEVGFSYIVRPDGFDIPKASSDIHGITHDVAMEKGKRLSDVLSMFDKYAKESSLLVAHNMDFDYRVAGSEYLRSGVPINDFIMLHRICTMKSTTDFCKLPGKFNTYKWPTLQELHFKIFNKNFDGAHDAGIDVEALVNCFLALKVDGFYDHKWIEFFG